MKRRFYLRAAMRAAAAMSLVATCAPSTVLATDTIVSSAQTSNLGLTGTDTLTVTSAGSIEVTGTNAVDVAGIHTAVSIDNSGIISAWGGGIGIYVDGTEGSGTTITNQVDALISASTTAIYYNGDLDGTLTNAGTIQASATSNYATGVYVSGALSGDLTNSGTISADASSSTSANAYGIYIEGDLAATGTLTNSGAITATANATYSGVEATGIYIGGDVTSILTNSGAITATATTLVDGGEGGGTAGAYGIDINGDVSGTVLNTSTGVITATALASYSAYATGIYVGGDLTATGNLTNSGEITVTAHAKDGYPSTAAAYGIYVNNDVSGTLANDGTINVNATNDYDYASATGIYVGGNLTATGTISNAGVINVTGTANDNSDVMLAGIRVNGEVTGALTNSGTISLDAVTGYSNTAYGIHTGELKGTLTNDGEITVTGQATDDINFEGIHVDSVAATGVLTNNGLIDVSGLNSDDTMVLNGIHVAGDMAGTLNNTGTITVAATQQNNTSSGITGYGIGIEGNLSGTLTNSGEITVATVSTYDYDNEAYGVYVSNELSGSLTNSSTGTISANASNSDSENGYYATAYGVYVGGNVSGTITNDGTISANASNNYSDATATGIYISGNLSGTLTNNGAITATAMATYSDASAAGVSIGGDLSGTLINGGTISAAATGSSSATATAIYVGGNLSGTLTNSGSISATASNSNNATATAYGIYISGDLSGTLTNTSTGTISATATHLGTSYASATAIYVGGDLYGTLANSGTISAIATVNSTDTNAYSATAYGVNISGNVSGTLTNDGVITVSASSNRSDAEAYGIYLSGEVAEDGQIVNSGAISAQATGHESASAYGIHTGYLEQRATISNSGTITATAISTYSNASAFGIATGSLADNAAITNSGTIMASATAYSWAGAEGIITGDLGEHATITNSGNITATAMNTYTSNYASAYGINSGNLDAHASITNSGTILAQATGNSWAGAYGIGAGHLDTGASINNSGIITATAVETDTGWSSASAYGIYTGDLAAGASINNSGTIAASAKGLTDATAYGIDAGDLDFGASINNSGIITATSTITALAAEEPAEFSAAALSTVGYAYGIRADSMTAGSTITNSGTITASSMAKDGADDDVAASYLPNNANAYSVWVGDGGEGTSAGLVDNSGTLNGNLYLGGTVDMDNSGTVFIPDNAEGYVGGNYAQTANGVFKLGVDSNSYKDGYGSLFVAGGADLAAGTGIEVHVTPGNTLALDDSILDVIDAGTLTASTFTMTDNSVPFNFSAVIDENTVDLTVDSASTIRDSVVAAGSTTGVGAAQAFDDLIDGSVATGSTGDADLDAYIVAMGNLHSDQAVADAIEQTLPLLTGNLNQASLDALRNTEHAVQDRLHSKKGMASGDPTCKIGRQAWLKPFGSWADQSNRKGVSGFDGDTYGLILGADTEMAIPTRLGVAVAYSHSAVDGKSEVARHNADIDTYQAMVYGSHSLGNNMDLDFQANIGMNQNEGERIMTLANKVASSDYDSTSLHLGVGLGRTYKIDAKNTLVPSVRVDYSWLDDENYTETGAGGLSLNVDGNTVDELILGIDGQWNHTLSNSLMLTAKLGLGYDALAEESAITASFVGGGAAFSTAGLDPSPLLVRGGLGLVMYQANGFEFTASYDFEARSDFSNHTAGLKVLKSF